MIALLPGVAVKEKAISPSLQLEREAVRMFGMLEETSDGPHHEQLHLLPPQHAGVLVLVLVEGEERTLGGLAVNHGPGSL